MPRISCQTDGLDWTRVRQMIRDIFGQVEIEIRVYQLGDY